MKKNYLSFYFQFLFMILLIGLISCETESLIEEQETQENLKFSNSSDGKKTKGKKSNGGNFDFSNECMTFNKTDLYAGQNILVGDISVSVDGDSYNITYNLTNSSYCLTSTHLSVVSTPEDFPLSGGGNPKNGHFEFSESHDCVNSYTYSVPRSKGNYIAAHAVVNCVEQSSDIDILSNLPTLTNVCITARGSDAVDSYFNITINDTSLIGDFDAWCIDVDLDPGVCFEANVYSSLEGNFPSSAFENPENFDKINWIMNQGFIGKTSSTGVIYNYGHIQWAIWELIDDRNCALCTYLTNPSGEWYLNRTENEAVAMEIVQAALNNGTGYIPNCDEYVSVILIPNNNTQPIFISIPVKCPEVRDCEETAWGDGCDFPGNNWATYFYFSYGA